MKQFLMCFAAVLVACVSSNPGADLKATQKTFAATVRSLTVLKNAGKLNKEEIKDTTELINKVNNGLKDWETAYAAGLIKPELSQTVKKFLTALISLESKAKE